MTLIIMAIVGMGVAYITGRASVAQRYMNAQNLAFSQMRNSLQTASTGSCNASNAITVGASTSVSAPCSYTSTSYAITAVASGGTSSATVSVSAPGMGTAASDSTANALFGGQIAITP